MTKLESSLNNSVLYHPLRFSSISEFFYEAITAKTKNTALFYKNFLFPVNEPATALLAFDIGANKGNKTKALLKLGFNVVALEPEKKSISTLEYRYKNNSKVKIVKKGVASQEGATNIYITQSRSGLNTMNTKWKDRLHDKEENRWNSQIDFKKSYEVPLTTIDNLTKEFGNPYFVKIDVEGFELEVIKSIKYLPDFISFEANLPEFTEETLQCIETLYKLNNTITFNYSFTEQVVAETWLTAAEMTDYIKNTNERYIEIICKRN